MDWDFLHLCSSAKIWFREKLSISAKISSAKVNAASIYSYRVDSFGLLLFKQFCISLNDHFCVIIFESIEILKKLTRWWKIKEKLQARNTFRFWGDRKLEYFLCGQNHKAEIPDLTRTYSSATKAKEKTNKSKIIDFASKHDREHI